MMSLGTDPYSSYLAYKQESEDIKTEATEMYYFLQERRLLTHFGTILFQKNLINRKIIFAENCRESLFRIDPGFRTYNMMNKFKMYLKEYYLYKQTLKD